MPGITFRGGRLAPHEPLRRPRLRLATYLREPAVPAVVDWHSRVESWPMYGNDRYGDCVFAETGHEIQNHSTYGDGQTVTIPEHAVLDAYSAVTGFNPDDPASDRGTVIQDAMDYWRKTGIGGHRIDAFAEVNVPDRDEVRTAVNLFGGLSIGVDFPASAMDQFNAGQPWEKVRRDGGSLGGHCVELVGYDQDWLYAVTWGRVQRMSQGWWDAYVEEAWLPLLGAEWTNDRSGQTPLGVDLVGLGEEFTSLAGEPNPFRPDPEPPPQPPIPPAPSPVPVDPVADLVVTVRAALDDWLMRHG